MTTKLLGRMLLSFVLTAALGCSGNGQGSLVDGGAGTGGRGGGAAGGGSGGGGLGGGGMSGGGTSGATGGAGGTTSDSGGAAGGGGRGSGGTGGRGATGGAGGGTSCGGQTCSAGQICVHPSCGGAALACNRVPDGGTCPTGYTLGFCQQVIGGGSGQGCQPPPCTPPAAYCADIPASCPSPPTCGCLPTSVCHGGGTCVNVSASSLLCLSA